MHNRRANDYAKRKEYSGELVLVDEERVGEDEPANTVATRRYFMQVMVRPLHNSERVDKPLLQQWATNTANASVSELRKKLRRSWPDAVEQSDVVLLPATGDEVIQELSSHSSRSSDLVVLAEFYEFTEEQEKLLLPLLLRFIKGKRDSNDPDEILSVGSAIRKFVGIVPASEIGILAVLLDPKHRMVLPLDTQMEITKMVARKFMAQPPLHPDPEPVLAERLARLAFAYLNPYVLADKSRAAVVLNAMQALASMVSPHFLKAAEVLRETECQWLHSHLHWRLQQVLSEWKHQPLTGQQNQVISQLGLFMEQTRPA